jgi:hypothetical protein
MVEGRDALDYLHSQVSQDLRGLPVGDAVVTLVLEPTGKVVALARVLRSGDHAAIVDVDAGSGDALEERLRRFKIRVQAEISRIEWRCLAVRGQGAGAIRPNAGAVVVPAWWGDGTAVDLLGPAPQPPEGVPEGSPDDLERARVLAGWPSAGAEITASTIPAELGLESVAVSFTKGCYPGQELVERMDSRGASAPRSLRRLTVAEGSRPGDPVLVDGVEVGVLTSVAGDAALALVKRSAVEPGAPIS